MCLEGESSAGVQATKNQEAFGEEGILLFSFSWIEIRRNQKRKVTIKVEYLTGELLIESRISEKKGYWEYFKSLLFFFYP